MECCANLTCTCKIWQEAALQIRVDTRGFEWKCWDNVQHFLVCVPVSLTGPDFPTTEAEDEVAKEAKTEEDEMTRDAAIALRSRAKIGEYLC